MSRKSMQYKNEQPAAPQEAMRLDKFLKVSRLIKRRTVANDACSTGHITVNGKEGKPGTSVRVGDQIAVRFGEKLHTYEVVSVREHTTKQDAAEMYREVL